MPDPLDEAIAPDVWDAEDPRAVAYLELLLAGHDAAEAERIVRATWDGA